jgi:hypothetical protein
MGYRLGGGAMFENNTVKGNGNAKCNDPLAFLCAKNDM